MSETVTRDYSLTVRLSLEEKVALEMLARRFDLDKSATVRRVLTMVLQDGRTPLSERGQFVPLPGEGIVIPVRLSGKEPHDG